MEFEKKEDKINNTTMSTGVDRYEYEKKIKRKISIPPAELKDFLKQRYCVEGKTLQDISRELGVTKERVRQILRSKGIPRKLGPMLAVKVCVELFSKGMTKEEILENYCVKEEYVDKAFKKWQDNVLKSRFQEMYRKGLKYKDIATELGVDLSKVKALATYTISKGLARNKRVKWTEEDTNKLIELYNQRKKYSEIAEILSKKVYTVGTKIMYLRKKGVLQ